MKRQIKKSEELSEYAWFQGYYHDDHDNWDGATWLRNMNELRLRDLAICTLGEISGKKILDIGCGPGLYLLTFAHLGAKVAGQDLSKESTEQAISFLKKNGFSGEVKVGDATKLLFEDNSFDAVFTGDFFEHLTLPQKKQVICEVYRVLKPGGIVTIKTPNLQYLRFSILLKRIIAVLKMKSPLDIHIAHTKNNPNNEHHGLATFAEMEDLFRNDMFHKPEIAYCPLVRKGIPGFLSNLLFKYKLFSEHIIITSRKSIFYSLYP